MDVLDLLPPFVNSNEELAKDIIGKFSLEKFQKGELIFHSKKITTKLYIVSKGIVRLFFSKDEKEVCEDFLSVGQWAGSYVSFMRQIPYKYNMDTLTDVELYAIEYEDLMKVLDRYPEMERFVRHIMVDILLQLADRLTTFRFTSAKDKYEMFCNTYKDFYNEIPLWMIASYLGITQETLSRVRSN